MKLSIYKSKNKLMGQYVATIDFSNTQVQIISDTKKELDTVLKSVKPILKSL